MKYTGKIQYNKFVENPNIIANNFDFEDLFDLEVNDLFKNSIKRVSNEEADVYYFQCIASIEDDRLLTDEDLAGNVSWGNFGSKPGEPVFNSTIGYKFVKLSRKDFKNYMFHTDEVGRVIRCARLFNHYKENEVFKPNEYGSLKKTIKKMVEKEIGEDRKGFITLMEKDFFKNSPILQYHYKEKREYYDYLIKFK